LSLLAAAGCSTLQERASAPATSSAAPNTPAIGSSAAQPKSTAPLSDSAALQGTWGGRELSADSDAPCYLIISGKNFEFRGVDTNEWYKVTFTLREDANPKVLVSSITECCAPKYVGATDYAIFRLENGTLTLTAREPGNPDIPSSFDAPETRQFIFKGK